MTALHDAERPADGEPAGLLILHHGRGGDEQAGLGLGDLLDPDRRLHVIAPRAPLTPRDGPGHDWFVVERIGHPDATTFHAALAALAAFHDATWARTGVPAARTVLGGFSQGTAMAYALGLDRTRPAPAGVLALSGPLPTVAGWAPDLGSRPGLPVLIVHGRRDPAVDVQFARAARDELTRAGAAVDHRESRGGHELTARDLRAARAWLRERLPPRSAPPSTAGDAQP